MATKLNPLQELKKIGQAEDGAIDLGAAALWLAATTDPHLDPAPYRRHLNRLVRDTGAYLGRETGVARLAEALQQVLARRFGYVGGGDGADAPSTNNLPVVIDRRHGADTPLGILYLHVARTLGFHADAIDFPGHMLVSLSGPDGKLMIDPFGEGALLDARALRARLKAEVGPGAELTPQHARTLSNREVLLRMLDTLKVMHLKNAATEAALATIETMLLIAPSSSELWREAGILHTRLDHIEQAVAALETFLETPGSDERRYQASAMLQDLYSRLDVRG